MAARYDQVDLMMREPDLIYRPCYCGALWAETRPEAFFDVVRASQNQPAWGKMLICQNGHAETLFDDDRVRIARHESDS